MSEARLAAAGTSSKAHEQNRRVENEEIVTKHIVKELHVPGTSHAQQQEQIATGMQC